MEFTRKSLWWAISTVNTLADLRWKDMIVDINAMQDRYEGGAMREQKAIDRAALEFYDNDPEVMVEFLTRYCTNNANTVRDAWWEFLDTLFWKYNAGFVNDGNRITSPGYPAEWLERVIELDEPDHYKR